MQPQEQNPGEQPQPQPSADWQQPTAPVAPEAALPAPQAVPVQTPVTPPQPQPVQPAAPQVVPTPEQLSAPAPELPVQATPVAQPVAAPEPAATQALPEQDQGLEQVYQADETAEATDEGEYTGDEELVRWQATEHIHREKTAIWYGIFGVVVLVLIALAIFLVKSWTFAVLVPVMAAALIIYARRPPAVLDYTLSRKGLHVNDRLYEFELFKEFGLGTR